MKYWRGYLTAAILGAFTWMLMTFARDHIMVLDMFYPYATRLIQDSLAVWTGSVDFCLWQVIAVALVVAFLASVVLMIVLRWNPIQWLGWVCAVASALFFLHTAVYGLNTYAGPLAEDIRLESPEEFTETQLEAATEYYLEKANALSLRVSRDKNGDLSYPEFEELAEMAGDGFHTLTYDYMFPIFAGSTQPVKKLAWGDVYSSMGITGITMGMTGEAAVNPDIPVVSLPFTMCHEMAHRMCIAVERDANFAGFLACMANERVEFQYSGYFMAFRYCYNALVTLGTDYSGKAASRIYDSIEPQLMRDLTNYREYFEVKRDDTATNIANTANDTYIKASGDEQGIASYGDVCELLVSWHIQQVVLPNQVPTEKPFDPYDTSKIDLSTTITPPGEDD